MTESKQQEMEKELNKLLEHSSSEMLDNYARIEDIFQSPYYWPEIDTFRHEAGLCIIFGLYQAAIPFINHMLESFLKYSMGYQDSKKDYKKISEKRNIEIKELIEKVGSDIEKYEDKTLEEILNLACSKQLLSKKQKKKITAYQHSLAHTYSYSILRRILKDMNITIHGGENIAESEISQYIASYTSDFDQSEMPKSAAISYFLFADALIRDILEDLFP